LEDFKGLIQNMINENIIRKSPLFELYVENDHLVINNTDHRKDNGVIKISDILSLEIIRHLSIMNKIIEVSFGFCVPAKSNELRINMSNGFKDIVLTDCDIAKTESIVYNVNQMIIKKINETK
jgi:hypothetical protein